MAAPLCGVWPWQAWTMPGWEAAQKWPGQWPAVPRALCVCPAGKAGVQCHPLTEPETETRLQQAEEWPEPWRPRPSRGVPARLPWQGASGLVTQRGTPHTSRRSGSGSSNPGAWSANYCPERAFCPFSPFPFLEFFLFQEEHEHPFTHHKIV